jgi:hypothetical protein
MTLNPAGPTLHFLNVAYFFQLIYNTIFHTTVDVNFGAVATNFWVLVTVLAYILSIVLIGMLVYYSLRLHQIVDDDAPHYATISKQQADAVIEHSRWTHIRSLIESPQESDWRQAIIEADIMLDELLTKLGYVGAGVGDKLKLARETRGAHHFQTLDEAWAAHLVRNEIAHKGSEYKLSDQLAYRTISHYENVFREFNEI